MIPVIDIEKCDGCQECLEACPPEVITMVDGRARIDNELCEECGECVDECSSRAIYLPRK